MNELIKISDHDGKKAVSARDLHTFLESKREFATWVKDRIKKYGLVENQDYVVFDDFVKNPLGGRPQTEYALSIDCAKELAMVEGNAKGKQARQYFIACEKQLKSIEKPLSQLEVLQHSVNMLVEQDRRIGLVENEVKVLKAQQTTRSYWYTIAGFGTLNGISIGLKHASSLGRKASQLCKERGVETETIPDPRFGTVKLYPSNILEEVFSLAIN